MDKNSKFNFQEIVQSYVAAGKMSPKVAKILVSFYETYLQAMGSEAQKSDLDACFTTFARLVSEQCEHPYEFQPFHQQVHTPFDYHQFGIDFLRPLIDKKSSSVQGKKELKEIVTHINAGHNVIFLANHQTEADPQAISLLLEEEFPLLAHGMILVAGERVITDPLAIPFSMGCNLLCIYSKRYIDHPPEKKHEKQLHNSRTMQLMSSLLSEGGKCIYIAPSGGRDRRNSQGEITIAPFDPKSLEMVYLMAKKAKRPTFFYPMALATYEMLPPPEKIQMELGEKRLIQRTGIHLGVGPQIDMEHFPGSTNPDKELRRKCRAEYIWGLVNQDYHRFPRIKK